MKISIAKTIFLLTLWVGIYGLYATSANAVQEHTQKVKQALKKAKNKQEVKKVFSALVNCETNQCVGGMTFPKRKDIFLQVAKQEKINIDGF